MGSLGRASSGRVRAGRMAKALTWTDVPRESAEVLLTAPFSPETDEEVIRECMRVECVSHASVVPLTGKDDR